MYGGHVPQKLIAAMNEARLDAYRVEWARVAGIAPAQVSTAAVSSLYVWQVSLSAAWFETLSYTEIVIRNSLDKSLRTWNLSRGKSEDWLDDPATPLSGLVGYAAGKSSSRAQKAKNVRGPGHPRYGMPVTLDDRVSQLEFGTLPHFLPQRPPTSRANLGSGFTARENLWINALRHAFPAMGGDLTKSLQSQLPPGLPSQVVDAYAVGLALERLRRLRNRVFHHEQTFQVEHSRRLKDVAILLRGVDHGAAEDLKRLDTVRRILAMRPQP